MSGKLGLFVVAVAATVLMACESASLAGHRHGGRGCASCNSGCATCAAPAACDKAAATTDPSATAPVAKADDASPSPQVMASAPTTDVKYVSRRASRRGWRR